MLKEGLDIEARIPYDESAKGSDLARTEGLVPEVLGKQPFAFCFA
jgi:hypothetical protein